MGTSGLKVINANIDLMCTSELTVKSTDIELNKLRYSFLLKNCFDNGT